jgi:tetratricopeptide (TPR) repeat protein
MNRKRALTFCILIVAAGFAVYANALHGDFIWDDEYLVQNNVFIRDGSHVAGLLTEDFGSGGGKTYGYYRPLQGLAYAAGYALWGLDVRGYHAMSILMHVVAALMIFFLIRLLFHDPALSFFTAILYVVHPIHTEAVAYMSGLGDPLSLPFLLLAVILYVRKGKEGRTLLFAAMIASYALALLAKEGSLILPGLLLVYHFVFRERIKTVRFLSLVAVAGAYLLCRLLFLSKAALQAEFLSGVFQRVPGFFVAVVQYLRLLALPFGLHMDYGQVLFPIASPLAVAGVAVVLGLLGLAVRLRDRSPIVSFSILWFFVALLPFSNLYSLAFYMAEHFLYLPSIGFFLFLGWCILRVYRRGGSAARSLGVALLVFLAGFYGFLTVRQNGYWSDPLTFSERTLRLAPGSVRVTNDLGRLYLKLGRKSEALALFRKAAALDPGYALPYINIGAIYVEEKRYGEAIAVYEKALSLLPGNADTYYNLANAYLPLGRLAEAEQALQQAIRLNPRFAEAYVNLGIVYTNLGRTGEAIVALQKAVQLNPRLVYGYYNLGLVYRKTGNREEALRNLETANRVDPGFGPAWLALAELYADMGKLDQAARYCDRASRLGVAVPAGLLRSLKR